MSESGVTNLKDLYGENKKLQTVIMTRRWLSGVLTELSSDKDGRILLPTKVSLLSAGSRSMICAGRHRWIILPTTAYTKHST